MLKLLLDEQISPDVAEGLRRRSKRLEVLGLGGWRGGRFLGLDDDRLLKEAAHEQLTLVTYDRKTIPPLLKDWAQAERTHGGVVFVDPESFPASDFGGLIRALHQLWSQTGEWDWANRVVTPRR